MWLRQQMRTNRLTRDSHAQDKLWRLHLRTNAGPDIVGEEDGAGAGKAQREDVQSWTCSDSKNLSAGSTPSVTKPGSVTRWLEQLRSEDVQARNAAAAAIWQVYCQTLLDLACQNLDARLRRRVGAEDVVQSTFKSFFLRQQRGQYDLADRNDLLRLLIRMALNKTRSAAKKETRHRRNYRRDQSPTTADSQPGETDDWLFELAQRGEPTPDEAAALAEEAERRLAQLPEDLRQIALWKWEGHSNAEIAVLPQMRCTERTVERKLRLIREAWKVPE